MLIKATDYALYYAPTVDCPKIKYYILNFLHFLPLVFCNDRCRRNFFFTPLTSNRLYAELVYSEDYFCMCLTQNLPKDIARDREFLAASVRYCMYLAKYHPKI